MVSPKVLIVGYYGFGNAGDERLLDKTVALVKDCFPNARLCALIGHKSSLRSHNAPFKNSVVLGELTVCKRRAPFSVLSALLSCNKVVFGGGSLLQDTTSFQSLLAYLSLIWAALILKKPVYLIGQGFAPFKRPLSKWLVSKTLQRVCSITVRDTPSQTFLATLKISTSIVASDLAYYRATIAPQETVTKPPLVGLSLIPQHVKPIHATLETFFNKNTQDFMFIECQTSTDNQSLNLLPTIAPKVIAHVNLSQILASPTASHALDQYKLMVVIAMRYHACVWASLQGIPFLALAYDPKVQYLAQALEQPFIDLSQGEPALSDFVSHYNTLMANYATYQARIREQAMQLIQKSQLNKATLC